MSGRDIMEPLVALYETYTTGVQKLEQEKKPMAGWFGLPGGPKDDPCQRQFAADAEALFASLAAEGPDSAQARCALEYVLRAPQEHTQPLSVYWMLQAVQGMACPLVDLLTREDACALRGEFVRTYRPWQRLPAQKKLLTALEKAGK